MPLINFLSRNVKDKRFLKSVKRKLILNLNYLKAKRLDQKIQFTCLGAFLVIFLNIYYFILKNLQVT